MKTDEEQDILWDQTLDRMFVTFTLYDEFLTAPCSIYR